MVKMKTRHVVSCLLAVLVAAVLLGQAVWANYQGFGFGPQTYKSGYAYGNGVYFAPYDFTIYTEPRSDAPVVGHFHWDRDVNTNAVDVVTANGEHHQVYADHMFFCFFPQLDVAMMAVTGENGKGWVEVVYNQDGKKTGWVRLKDAPTTLASASSSTPSLAPLEKEPEHFGVYQTWLEFMKLNAKASGIYWLSGVSQYQRSVRSADTDDAKLLPITIIRDIKVKHVRGNWLLVEVLDFERNTPIGWVRWRDDNGELMVFPNLSGQHSPIVTTTF